MQIDLAGAVVEGFYQSSTRPQPSQTELIKSIAPGDRRAMHVLFAQHRLRAHRFALRLVNDEDAAEDLVSQVFLEVWRHAGSFEERCRVSTWLLAITRNRALSMLRRPPVERLGRTEAAAIADHANEPDVALQIRQQSAILAYCLTKLSLVHREVIDLVYHHGRSIHEVAVITGVRPNTVKTRMFYARNQIAKLLGGFGMRGTFPASEAFACKLRAPRPRNQSMARGLPAYPKERLNVSQDA